MKASLPAIGFVSCDCCGNAMTAAWSKGKYRHYAYNRCETRGCEAKSKSVPRAKMDEGFAEILKGLQSAKGLFELAKAILIDAWEKRHSITLGEKDVLRTQLDETTSKSKVCSTAL